MTSLDLSRQHGITQDGRAPARLSVRAAAAVIGTGSLLAWAGIVWAIA